jgi:hypothetical protein
MSDLELQLIDKIMTARQRWQAGNDAGAWDALYLPPDVMEAWRSARAAEDMAELRGSTT